MNYNDCEASNNREYHVDSIAAWAQKAGKGTGIVTTTTVTHASPSGAYSHSSNRMWESDADVAKNNKDPAVCRDNAYQLMYGDTGSKFDVIFGGGRKKFLPETVSDEDGNKGERKDGNNLIDNWKLENRNKNSRYIFNRKGLQSLDASTPSKVLGLFASSHLAYYLDADHEKEPTLAEMTEGALKVLEKKENGYFLFVEGGKIDHGHHENKAEKALSETLEFSKAIELAVNRTSREDTLIVVTSDHSHTMTVSGYPDRGNNILGINTERSDIGESNRFKFLHHILLTLIHLFPRWSAIHNAQLCQWCRRW